MIKKLLIVLVIVAVAGGGYYFFVIQKPSAGTSSLVKTSNGVTQSANPSTLTDVNAIGDIGQEFLTSLLSLKKMTLNDGVFSDPAFISLQDFTRPLVQLGNEGRPNPFAPIGTDPISVSSSSTQGTSPTSEGDTNALLNQLLNQSAR